VRKGWSASTRGLRRLALGVALAGIVTSGAAGCVATRRPLLLVEDVTGQRVLHRAAVAPGSILVLSYVHSSEHVPVRGTFVVEPDGALRVTETAFAGFGPGLPHPTAGDAWRLEDGMIVVPSAGERLSELRVRVAPFTRHRLRTPSGDDLDLSHLMPEGGTILIRLEPGNP
jgi:hypothetical protein